MARNTLVGTRAISLGGPATGSFAFTVLPNFDENFLSAPPLTSSSWLAPFHLAGVTFEPLVTTALALSCLLAAAWQISLFERLYLAPALGLPASFLVSLKGLF